jgi:hypothetical protein
MAPLNPDTVNRSGVQAMICLAILLCNLELYVCKKLITTLTAEEGVFVKRSHSHRMFLRTDIGWTMCDRCHQRIRESTCYNCATCDWDVCHGCIRADMRKESKQRADEGADDDGDDEEEVSYSSNTVNVVLPLTQLVVRMKSPSHSI